VHTTFYTQAEKMFNVVLASAPLDLPCGPSPAKGKGTLLKMLHEDLDADFAFDACPKKKVNTKRWSGMFPRIHV